LQRPNGQQLLFRSGPAGQHRGRKLEILNHAATPVQVESRGGPELASGNSGAQESSDGYSDLGMR